MKDGADAPIESRSLDELNHARYAKLLAAHIAELDDSRGYVVAIQGKWGTGKTSLLNMIDEYLSERTYPKKRHKPIVIRFEAWWYSGAHDVLEQLLREIAAVLTGKKQKTLAKLFGRLAHVSGVLQDLPMFGNVARSTRNVSREIANSLDPSDASGGNVSLGAVRTEIHKHLKRFEGRLLIIIDDIDRLGAGQAYSLVSAVAAVARFPKVTYLLAMDAERVAELVGSGNKDLGREFIKRLVQFPFEIPPLSNTMSLAITQKIAREFLGNDDYLSVETYEDDSFTEVVAECIETLRDAHRLRSAMRGVLALVGNEVHRGELLAIEALRIMAPGVVDQVARHKKWLAPDPWTDMGQSAKPKPERQAELREKLRELREETEHHARSDVVTRVLCGLFPRYADMMGKYHRHYGGDDEWAHRRVSVNECFDIYLRRALGDEVESAERIAKWISGKEVLDLKKHAENVVRSQYAAARWGSLLRIVNSVLTASNDPSAIERAFIGLTQACKPLRALKADLLDPLSQTIDLLFRQAVELGNAGVASLCNTARASDVPCEVLCILAERLVALQSSKDTGLDQNVVNAFVSAVDGVLVSRVEEVGKDERLVYMIYAAMRMRLSNRSTILKESLKHDVNFLRFAKVHVQRSAARHTVHLSVDVFSREDLRWLCERCDSVNDKGASTVTDEFKLACNQLLDGNRPA